MSFKSFHDNIRYVSDYISLNFGPKVRQGATFNLMAIDGLAQQSAITNSLILANTGSDDDASTTDES